MQVAFRRQVRAVAIRRREAVLETADGVGAAWRHSEPGGYWRAGSWRGASVSRRRRPRRFRARHPSDSRPREPHSSGAAPVHLDTHRFRRFDLSTLRYTPAHSVTAGVTGRAPALQAAPRSADFRRSPVVLRDSTDQPRVAECGFRGFSPITTIGRESSGSWRSESRNRESTKEANDDGPGSRR